MSHLQNIYLVDDDVSVRKSLSRALKLRGYQVETFDTAQNFLKAFSKEFRGCLLLDLSMPAMSGLELQNELLEMGSSLPVIFITGHGGVPESVEAMKRGAIDFLEKPFAQEALIERIDEALITNQRLCKQRKKQEKLHAIFNRLTDRELQVLQLLVSGAANLSNKEMAEILGVSFRTVDHHRARIMEKTEARSFAELARMADAAGIIKHTDDEGPWVDRPG